MIASGRGLLVRSGLVLVAVLALAGCDWAQLGFDASHRSFNPVEPALTATSVQHLAPAWTCPTSNCDTRPLVADGKVFSITDAPIGGSHAVVAMDATTGAPLWTASGGTFPGIGAVANGLVYGTDNVLGDASVFALDEATGVQRFRTVAPKPDTGLGGGSVVAVAGDAVFVLYASSNGASTLSAFDTAGHMLWTAGPPGSATSAAVSGTTITVLSYVDLSSAPFAVIVLRSYALDTGIVQRTVIVNAADNTGRVLLPNSDLSIVNGIAYFTQGAGPSTTGGLVAADLSTGAIRWKLSPLDVAGFAVAPNDLVVQRAGGGVGALRAVDPLTGAPRWSADLPSANFTPEPVPAIAGSLVYVGGASLQVHDLATGSLVTTYGTTARIFDGPVPSEGHVYVVEPNANLLALAPST